MDREENDVMWFRRRRYSSWEEKVVLGPWHYTLGYSNDPNIYNVAPCGVDDYSLRNRVTYTLEPRGVLPAQVCTRCRRWAVKYADGFSK